MLVEFPVIDLSCWNQNLEAQDNEVKDIADEWANYFEVEDLKGSTLTVKS